MVCNICRSKSNLKKGGGQLVIIDVPLFIIGRYNSWLLSKYELKLNFANEIIGNKKNN